MSAAKERPILFSGPMVRAIFEGRKTQTRRVVRYPANGCFVVVERDDGSWWPRKSDDGESLFYQGNDVPMPCPYGFTDDRLWVRESWRVGAWREDGGKVACDYKASPEITHTPWVHPTDFEGEWIRLSDTLHAKGVTPDADGQYRWPPGQAPLPWRSPRFMPRWASRLLLEITDVRVQRVQEISEENARAEGMDWAAPQFVTITDEDREDPREVGYPSAGSSFAVGNFRNLWDSINAKRGHGWDSNPWVWAITFRRGEVSR